MGQGGEGAPRRSLSHVGRGPLLALNMESLTDTRKKEECGAVSDFGLSWWPSPACRLSLCVPAPGPENPRKQTKSGLPSRNPPFLEKEKNTTAPCCPVQKSASCQPRGAI